MTTSRPARGGSLVSAGARECPPVPKCTRLVPAETRNLAIAGNTTCPFAGLLCKPSDGLEPSTPSLPRRFSCRAAGRGRRASRLVFLHLGRFFYSIHLFLERP